MKKRHYVIGQGFLLREDTCSTRCCAVIQKRLNLLPSESMNFILGRRSYRGRRRAGQSCRSFTPTLGHLAHDVILCRLRGNEQRRGRGGPTHVARYGEAKRSTETIRLPSSRPSDLFSPSQCAMIGRLPCARDDA